MSIYHNYALIIKEYLKNREDNFKLILNRKINDCPKIQRPRITAWCYEVVRREVTLNFIALNVDEKFIKKSEPYVRAMIFLALYFLFFTEKKLKGNIVNALVSVVPLRAKSYFNWFLRQSLRQEKELACVLEKAPLNIKLSFHEEIIPFIKNLCLKSGLSVDFMLEYLNKEPVFHLKCFDYEKLEKELIKRKLSFYKLEKLDSLLVNEKFYQTMDLIKQGLCYVQNSTSQLISYIANKITKGNVLDLCAAPGTKSLTLSLLNPTIKITAVDSNKKRVEIMKKSLDQKTQFKIFCSDARKDKVKGNYDLIILDAPCSSLGTIRKNPDIKSKIGIKDIRENASVQKEILSHTFKSYPQSKVLYSVCSFTTNETDDVIKDVLSQNKQRKNCTKDIIPLIKLLGFNFYESDLGVYILPHEELNSDLFYISLLI